jgi:Domain of unknown function (DUF1883)/TIR domain
MEASCGSGNLGCMPTGPPFQRFDLGQCKKGDVWRVELTAAANVFLADSANFSAFRANRRFRYQGGLLTRSPHDFVIPRNGHWYLVAHTWGLRRGGRISVTPLQIASAMPPARHQQVDLDSIARQAAAYSGSEDAPAVAPADKEYDVFICHASEDKEDIARPLAQALRSLGLTVWFDEFTMRIGSSLRREIDTGLANSRFGVVILSVPFFDKGWSNYELDGLVTREVSGPDQIILPVWHRVTKAEVQGYSPSLADKLARSTHDSTVEEIASEIAEVIATARGP